MAQIKDLAVGDGFVCLLENGVKTKFYLLAHNYESGLNGTGRALFVRESPVTSGTWSNRTTSIRWSCGWGDDQRGTSAWNGADLWCRIYEYLNTTYFNYFSSESKNWISTTQYYAYHNAGGEDEPGKCSPMSSAVFTVSGAESIVDSSENPFYYHDLEDGTLLSYDARKRLERIFTAYGSGIWTRTLGRHESSYHRDSNDEKAYSYYHGILLSGVSDSEWGNFSYTDSSLIAFSSYGYLPCFTLPETLYVSNDGMATTNTAPSMPGGISIPSSIMGGTAITVSWAASSDAEGNLAGYILERSIDGGNSYTRVYAGTALACTDTITKGWPSVIYRVKAYDTEGWESAYNTSSLVAVINNVAPSAPSFITVPGNVRGGGTLAISWGAASDSDGNLAGYILERSIDGGNSYTRVYTGNALAYTDTITKGWPSVIYRVKAYDAEGLESAYKVSSLVTVINNLPPSAPPSITVPGSVRGGRTLTISWGAASDSDGNLAGYILERSTDGGSTYTRVYAGNTLTCTDTITKGWPAVMYRVKAYDAEGLESAYTVSSSVTVINNEVPTVTASASALGEKNAAFAFQYTVNDADGDSLTVTEKLDGKTTKTLSGVAGGTTLTFEQASSAEGFQKILNGSHTITIEVSDGKEGASFSASFTKAVYSASVTLAEPLAVEGDITVAVLQVTGYIPADATFTAEVTNNAKDASPVWQDAAFEVRKGMNIVFTNKTASAGAAFNFRIRVERGSSGEGGYIETVSGAFQ